MIMYQLIIMFILISRELILSDGLGMWRIRSLYGRNATDIYVYIYILGMHNIIGLISESADNGFKCKYRHRPDMKNYADMSCW